ncbi:nuclear transport factor 2 family protein [Cyanobium sp. NS01]|uniref:nuclear transport factor 2 family protein n=1 Tax=Cyanobium sp. NS01 TaxID=261284 RepID=UPI00164819BE|nr:nuclear transport factor 2 family protein [Cyanobium sp. NS01]QNI71224.1 snoaL-like domain protein [Cyanobium sp. NS01]
MAELRELTQQYVAAFNAKDIDGVSALLTEDFSITDPSVTQLEPRDKAIEYIRGLFMSNSVLSFQALDIIVGDDITALHFALSLGEERYHGIDLINWKQDKISSILAYLTKQF